MPCNPNKIDYSSNFPKGFEIFQELVDPRDGGHTKHYFGEIIFIAFTAIVCGMKSYELIEEFGDSNENWFRTWLELPHGIPSYNTFSRVIEAVDPLLFSACIAGHINLTMNETPTGQIAIDGKAIRGSASDGKSHLHAVSAWACEEGLTLGQTFVDEKSNEITAIPELLKLINVEGCIVTIDAMGTQKNIATQIIDEGGDYILSVKGNQKGLLKEVEDYFLYCARPSESKPLSQETWDKLFLKEKNRGRLELRKTIVCNDLSWMQLEYQNAWKSIKSIIFVQRQVLEKGKVCRTETHYYISSVTNLSAKEAHLRVRSHWGIENSCHWVLDTLFREDHNQTSKPNAVQNLATMRRIALNALKKATNFSRRKKPASLVKKQVRAAQSIPYREEVLSLV